MKESKTPRLLGFGSLLALGVNGIVGVGIFFIPADLAGLVPPASSPGILVLTALLLSPIVAVYASLAERFDDDGGPVLYARAAFGDSVGYFVGWLAYLSAVASTSAVIFNLSLRGIWPALAPALGLELESAWGPRLLGLAMTLGLALLCSRGLKLSARAWSTLTVLKLIPLVSLVVFGALHESAPTAAVVSSMATPWTKALLVSVFVFQGFEIVPLIAGRSSSGPRGVSVAMIVSVWFTAMLYVALQTIAVRAVPDLAHSHAPLVDVAGVVGGSGLATLVRVGTNVSALGIAVGMMTMTPWYLSTASRQSLGAGLADVDGQGVPRRALLVTTVLVLVLVSLGGSADLFALSSLAVVIQYLSAALAFLWIGQGWRKLLAIAAAIVSLVIASGASKREVIVAAGGLLLGVVIKLTIKPKPAANVG